MKKDSTIFVAGHNGMVGSAIMRCLQKEGYTNIITRNSKDLDLRNQTQVNHFFKTEDIEYVFLAAAKVGGIQANNIYRASFIYDNTMIASNVIHASYINNVKKLLFLGSTCIYPKNCPQPIKEPYLLTGPLEQTNEPYAIAKILGIKMCESYRRQYGCNFISAMPTNLYGINDNFDLENSHVIPALIRKIHEAKVNQHPYVTVWGTGKPKREFLFVDDVADASLHLMSVYNEEPFLNIGYGKDISINELVEIIKQVVGYKGDIRFDTSKPDGTLRKLTDCTAIHNTGWMPKTSLKEGLEKTYNWFEKMNP